MDVSGRTRIVGIFGDPVTHSLSPSMHNAAFRALRLDYLYVAFHVLPTQLRRAVAGIRALDLVGVNITVPHKQRVMIMLDSVGARAQRAGAVNTIINRGGQLHGENTDIDGFLRAVGAAQVELRGARVLLVGAGGAARGALAGLGEAGVSAVTVVNRTPQRARQLAAAMGRCGASATAAPLSALRDRVLLGNTDLVVNATSLGLAGEPFFSDGVCRHTRSLRVLRSHLWKADGFFDPGSARAAPLHRRWRHAGAPRGSRLHLVDRPSAVNTGHGYCPAVSGEGVAEAG